MPIATSPSLPSPATFVKMEDRKRPALSAVDDLAPPSKRQAVNGGGKSKDDATDTKEEAWIEEYQKGAIYRQMLEYKREKTNLEARLHELEKSSAHHDDHVRIIDAWLLQVLNEIELLVEGVASSSSLSSDPADPSSLTFKDSKDFQRHLGDKGKVLKGKIESLFRRLSGLRGQIKPEVAQLESQVKTLLAAQKELHIQIARLETEKASLSEQYDTAALKVIKAERKLDRARSAQVQKLEQQALAHATARTTGTAEENGETANELNGDREELRMKYQATIAIAEKQKQQLEASLSEIKGLQDENATFKAKKESITDEDYARTDVFKQFKAQNEDLIKRINNLEAINKQLREEAEKLQAERTSFRNQLEIEAQVLTLELEDQIQQKDQDLTRIRSARDELFAEVSMRKASQEQERTASAQVKELVEAKDDRITALESELDRLRPQEDVDMTTPREDIEALSLAELRQRYLKLSKDFEAINKEMPLLEKSYKKSASLAHKKVMDFMALEERVAILTAEKSKADQKYFAARRDMDVSKAENRALRVQNGKSSEIISQLKDVETQNRSLISTLEKQMADLRQSNTSLATDNKRLEASTLEATRRADAAKAQISDLMNLVKAKDATNIALKEEKMASEQEVASLKARLTHVTTERDTWKKKKLSNSTEEEDLLRNMLVCSVCRDNFKNTILRGCGHMFCNKCVEDRLTNRMRKCPTCNKAFDRSEAMTVHL